MSGLRTAMASVALIAVGYGTWALIVPEGDRKKELVKNLPEANPLRMEETRQRNALVMQAIKEAAETDDNIARRIGGRPR